VSKVSDLCLTTQQRQPAAQCSETPRLNQHPKPQPPSLQGHGACGRPAPSATTTPASLAPLKSQPPYPVRPLLSIVAATRQGANLASVHPSMAGRTYVYIECCATRNPRLVSNPAALPPSSCCMQLAVTASLRHAHRRAQMQYGTQTGNLFQNMRGTSDFLSNTPGTNTRRHQRLHTRATGKVQPPVRANRFPTNTSAADSGSIPLNPCRCGIYDQSATQ